MSRSQLPDIDLVRLIVEALSHKPMPTPSIEKAIRFLSPTGQACDWKRIEEILLRMRDAGMAKSGNQTISKKGGTYHHWELIDPKIDLSIWSNQPPSGRAKRRPSRKASTQPDALLVEIRDTLRELLAVWKGNA